MNRQELDDLILSYLSGSLGEDEVRRLERALEELPEGGQRFAELALQEGLLLEMKAEYQAEAASAEDEPESEAVASAGSGRFRTSTRSSRRVSQRRSRRRSGRTRTWLRYGALPLAAAAAAMIVAYGIHLRTLARRRAALCAEVLDLDGEVEAFSGRSQRRAVKQGETLKPGTTLATSPGATVRLRYPDKSTLEVKERAELTLRRHEKAKRVHLEKGELSADIAKQPAGAPMVLDTPHAEAKVLGTRFLLRAEAVRTQLEVDRGSVRLTRSDGKSADVTDGHYAVAERGTLLAALPISGRPRAVSLRLTTGEDIPCAVNLSAAAPAGGRLRFEVLREPQHGRLGGEAPKLTYTPDANYHGPDSFALRASDGATSADSSVSMTVSPVNDAPRAEARALAVEEDGRLAVTLKAADIESGPLKFEVTIAPEHGKLEGTPPQLTYVPKADYGGKDEFTFQASDEGGATGTAKVTITVRPVNDPPVARIAAQPARGMVPLKVTFSGEDSSDPEGKITSYWWNFADNRVGRTARLDHVFTRPGTYRVRLTVRDAKGLSATSEAQITVDPDPEAVAAPTGLTGHYGGRPKRFVLSWKDNSDNEEGFYIERAELVSGKRRDEHTYQRLAVVGPNVTLTQVRITPTPRKTGTFYFRVCAFNAKTGRVSSYSYFFITWNPKSGASSLNWPPPGEAQ